MRMPRFRFTVRRLMVAVAIVAIVIGSILWVGRMRRHMAQNQEIARVCRLSSARYASRATLFRKMAGRPPVDGLPGASERWSDIPKPVRQTSWDRAIAREAGWMERMSTYRAVLAANHERAARYPWLPVVPGPPAPK